MTTETDIANLALDILKEAPITSLDQDRPTASWMKRNFDFNRDAVLAMMPWNCALKRVKLPADGTSPAFGWDYRYGLPSDCIRLLPVTNDGTMEGRPVQHEVEAGYVLTNKAGPLKVRYISRLKNYSAYPALLIEAVSARLALRMAHWMTGKSSYVQIAQAHFDRALHDAWLSDAIEGSSPRAADNEWIDAR